MKKLVVGLALLTSLNTFAQEKDQMIASIKAGGDQDCPVLVTENSSTSCARFGFADSSLQMRILKSVKAASKLVRISGEWSTRETGEGTLAPIFVITYITLE